MYPASKKVTTGNNTLILLNMTLSICLLFASIMSMNYADSSYKFQFQLITLVLLNLYKNHLPAVNLDMFSVVTLTELPKMMTDGTEKYFSGNMYEYDSSEHQEIEVRYLQYFF